MNSIPNRIELIIKYYNMSYNSFAKSLGLANGTGIKTMIDNNRNPQNQTLNKIVNTYPEIDMNWLRTGTGQMISNLPESMSGNDDLTVTAKQVISQLDINNLHYSAILDKKMSDDREYYDSVTKYNTTNHSKHIADLLEGFKSLENRLETKFQEQEIKMDLNATKRAAGVSKLILKKLEEDRQYYSNDAASAQNIINILNGFKTLESRVEKYANSASTKVVDQMSNAIAKQNELLIEGYEKVISLERELEDIKTYMAANFELDKMSKKKSKKIKRLNPKKNNI